MNCSCLNLLFFHCLQDSIKIEQQALKDEIAKIKSEFYNLIHSCAFDDSDLSTSVDVPQPVCSPPKSATRMATPGKDSSPKKTPAKGGCSYGDKLIQMMLEMPSSYLDDSELSESLSPRSQGGAETNSPKSIESLQTEGDQENIPQGLKCEKDVNSNQPCLQNFSSNETRADMTSELSYYPDRGNKPFVDSIRFNPDSVLNSTSICEADASKAVINCTRAQSYSSLNCVPGFVNPASVLNCTPAAVNPSYVSHASAMENTASIIVNPASVLDCYPPQVTQSSMDSTQAEGSSLSLNYVNCTSDGMKQLAGVRHVVGEAQPLLCSNSSVESHPSSQFRDSSRDLQTSSCVQCTAPEADPSICVNCSAQIHPSSGFTYTGDEPPSSACVNCTSANCDPSSHLTNASGRDHHSSCQNCSSPVTIPSAHHQSAPTDLSRSVYLKSTSSRACLPSMISYRSDLDDTSCHSSSESDLAQPLAESTSASLNPLSKEGGQHGILTRSSLHKLDVTPAVMGSSFNPLVLHSTPAAHTEKHSHLMPANFLNPTCSAIVDYSVSSSESDQSDTSSRHRGHSSSRPNRSSHGETSDLQVCPDRQQEMMSRMKYYSDFTIDRQRKINKMRKKQDVTLCQDPGSSSQDDVPNDTLCRFVEGAEERSHQVCLIGPPYSSRSGSIGSSSSGGSSTLQKTAVSQSKYSNSPSPQHRQPTDRVLKSTENTRHFPSVPRSNERHHSGASSTTSGNSMSPSSSVYAWSLQSSSHGNRTETSSHRHHKSSRHGDRRRGDKRPRKRSSQHRDSHREDKHIHCRDHDVHTMLGQPCNQVVKYLPIQQFYPKDLILSNDSLYDDGYKSQTLPRSSTKKSLNPCSSNSSLEAKRNSVPDICALKSPQHSALISSGSDSLSSKYPPGRMGCIGMSTTSGSQDSPGTDSSTALSKGARSSSLENNENTALTDSILTDSPKSVSSSGIFAPCNSPDATVGSRISCSTIADSQCSDLRGISGIQPNSTGINGLSVITTASDISEFKVPRGPAPKKSSRRKGNRCSTPDVRTSTPKPNSYPNSVQSDQISRRKLFSSSSSTHSSYGSSSRLLDKKSVIKKFRRFSENFYKTKSGKIQIETLANL